MAGQEIDPPPSAMNGKAMQASQGYGTPFRRRLAAGALALGVIGAALWVYHFYDSSICIERPSPTPAKVIAHTNSMSGLAPSDASASKSNVERELTERRSQQPAPIDSEVRAVLAAFEDLLQTMEAERARKVPVTFEKDGHLMIVAIPAPSLQQLGAMSEALAETLKLFSPEKRREAQWHLQKLYDEYASFREPYRLLKAIRGDGNWELYMLSIGESRNPTAKEFGGSINFMVDARNNAQPPEIDRWKHLLKFPKF
jgi:hypothetical protein